MKAIAWDTSSKEAALVAIEWQESKDLRDALPKVVAELALNVDITHSERLLWAVHSMLECARWDISEVDVFGVGVGPGSFTGLRVGVSTARTLAHELRRPLIGVSSLAALVRPAAEFALSQTAKTKDSPLILGAVDGAKNQWFVHYGFASKVRNSLIYPEGAKKSSFWAAGVLEQSIEPGKFFEAVQRKLKQMGPSGRWLALGDAVIRYPQLFEALPQKKRLPYADFWDRPIASIRGSSLGTLIWEVFQQGLRPRPLTIVPRYARVSDAEQKKFGVSNH